MNSIAEVIVHAIENAAAARQTVNVHDGDIPLEQALEQAWRTGRPTS